MTTQICLTRSLYVINIISFCLGARAFFKGVYQCWDQLFGDTKVNELDINPLGADRLSIFFTPYVIIGTFIFVVTIFYVLSDASKSTYCLKLYAAMNVMIIVGLIITCIIFFSRFESIPTKFMEKFVAVNFNHDKYNEQKESIDLIQQFIRCCGNTGPENYAQAEFFPSSCCLEKNCSLGIVYGGCNTKIPKIVNMYGWLFEKQKSYFTTFVVMAGIIELIEVMLALSIIYFSK